MVCYGISGVVNCAHSFVVLAVVKFMGKQFQNSNSGKQNDICGEKNSEKYSEF